MGNSLIKNGDYADLLLKYGNTIEVACSHGHEPYYVNLFNFKHNGTRCPVCYNETRDNRRTQNYCRIILEQLLDTKFKQLKISISELAVIKETFNFVPKRPFEIDGYSEELNLAFEYNGEQHYRFIPLWHNSRARLFEQQERDKMKQSWCQEKNIHLIIIPHWEAKKELQGFIEEEFTRHRIEFVSKKVRYESMYDKEKARLKSS